MDLKIQLLNKFTHSKLVRAYDYSAGFDLVAAIKEPITIQPGERILIPSGIKIEIPPYFEGQIRSRSGLSYYEGLIVLNSPGTIDNGYTNEISVLLINLGEKEYKINPGNRIAQFVLMEIPRYNIKYVNTISETTERKGRGFGSSGLN